MQTSKSLHDRWNVRSSQYSQPVYLEAGEHYYFEAWSNQGYGPWDIGLGVKLHNSTISGGLYESDFEEQRLQISSTTIQEEHVCLICITIVCRYVP